MDIRFDDFGEVFVAMANEVATGAKKGRWSPLPAPGTTFLLRVTDGVSAEYRFDGDFPNNAPTHT